jgi:hypothetical protein
MACAKMSTLWSIKAIRLPHCLDAKEGGGMVAEIAAGRAVIVGGIAEPICSRSDSGNEAGNGGTRKHDT